MFQTDLPGGSQSEDGKLEKLLKQAVVLGGRENGVGDVLDSKQCFVG
jgi:hypothetical protein